MDLVAAVHGYFCNEYRYCTSMSLFTRFLLHLSLCLLLCMVSRTCILPVWRIAFIIILHTVVSL